MADPRKLYRLTVAPIDGRFQIESQGMTDEVWHLLSVDDNRERSVQKLNWLFGSALGEPRLACPNCGQPLAYPGPCFVGGDQLFYCGEGCAVEYAAKKQMSLTTSRFLFRVAVGSTCALFLCLIIFLSYWHSLLQAVTK